MDDGAYRRMHDFGKIVYLDFQKTGSSFVSQFLRAACLHPERRLQKHVSVGADYREGTVYFTTIRHPLMLYSSLYRFGLDGRGGIFKNIAYAGHASIYESFESFCAFIVDARNASILHPLYNQDVASELGLMSFRHLLLSLQSPGEKIEAASARGEPFSNLMKQSIVSHVLKNELLNEELLKFATETLPEHFDRQRAIEFLDRSPRVNQSTRVPEAISQTSEALRAEIESREALLMSYYV